MTINLSTPAIDKVAELAAEGECATLALRIAVRPGGCSGFSYEMFFDGDTMPGDMETVFMSTTDKTVRVVVDPASAPLVSGATLDYKDGLNGAGFSFANPNAQRSCGCGKSFS